MPVNLARAPIDPNAKLLCVSYAPFRDDQTPLMPTTHISAEQIAQDLAQLAKISDCVRTYSIENGLDQVPALAAKVGTESHSGHLARQQPAEEPRPDLHRGLADQAISAGDHLRRRRKRGAAARRNDHHRSRRHDPFGEVPGRRPRHLCGRLGVLAAQSGDLRGGRLRHHSHPSLLGRFPDPRQIRRRPCRHHPQADGGGLSGQGNPDRRDRVAEPGPHAGRRAAVADQPGAGGLRNSRPGETGKFSRQPDRSL